MIRRYLGLSVVAGACFVFSSTLAFTFPQQQQQPLSSLIPNPNRFDTTRTSSTALFVDKKWFSADDEEESELVTREMFLRDQLEDPIVKRKRKGDKGGKKGYKPLDNRDHLPFAVKKITPDPYTNPQIKKANQKRVKSKKTDLDHLMTNSRLYAKDDTNDSSTLLGEFKLDKLTTSGDIIQIGDREFRVESARCQYKYAGGQRFVMVRKILEVKEVSRAIKEELLMKQFQGVVGSVSSSSTNTTSGIDYLE